MTTYKDHLKESMTEFGKDPDALVVGYNVCDAGGAGGGTFAGIADEKRVECPLAENLMAGAAIGLSLQGYIPLIWFERMDFILCGLDAICNHLAKLNELSEGIHRPACIIRVVVGNSKTPLFTGATHCQDYTDAVRSMIGFKVEKLTHKALIKQQYEFALNRAKRHRQSTMLVEYKDFYGN